MFLELLTFNERPGKDKNLLISFHNSHVVLQELGSLLFIWTYILMN